jgi:hypothetical protein
MGQVPMNRSVCAVRQMVAAAAPRVLFPCHIEFNKI